jgi:DNA repair protein RadC
MSKTKLVRESPSYRVYNAAGNAALVELLAVIIGGPREVESANQLLETFGLIGLGQADPGLLQQVPGIGRQTALRIKAALELGVRLHEPSDLPEAMNSPAPAAAILTPMIGNKDQEHLAVMLLNTRCHIMDVIVVYKGTANSSTVRVGEIFKAAVARNATSVIIAHNHPGGDPNPSSEDVSLTKAVKDAGKLLDISLLDHIVIGAAGRYVSMKEKGLF